MLDEHTLAVVYLSNDTCTRQHDLYIVAELRAALGSERVLVVTAQERATERERLGGAQVWVVPGLADAEDAALAQPFVLCAQLLGPHFSLAHGGTPDNPFPAGEVNRVVQGVTVHPWPV